jgi:sphinganine C4-monooxygenase
MKLIFYCSHDIHHQPHGIKTNFAQPFFTFWDKLLNTEYHQVMKAKAEAKAKLVEKSQ